MKKILFVLLILSAFPLLAAPFSPWDAWRQGYTMFEKGQQQRDRGAYRRALQYFEAAKESYESVRKARPDWNQKIIQGRLDDCQKAIAEVKLQLEDAYTEIFPESSSGNKKTGTPDSGNQPAYPQFFAQESGGGATLNKAEIEAQKKEIDKLRSENEQYKNRLLQTMVELDDLRRQVAQGKSSADEVSNLLREQRIMQEKYTLLEKRYKKLEEDSQKPDSRLAELRNQLLESKMSCELLQKRLELAEKRLQGTAESASEIPLLKKAYDNLKAEKEKADRIHAQQLAELEGGQKNIADERNSLRTQLDQLAMQLRSQREQFAAQTAELNSLREKLEQSLKAGGVSGLHEQMLAENRQLQEKISSLVGQLGLEQQKVQKNHAERQELLKELLGVRESLITHERKYNELQTELDNTRKGAERDRMLTEQAQNELKTLRERNQQLAADTKAWSEKALKLEERLNSLLAQSYKLQTELDNTEQNSKEQLTLMNTKQNTLNQRIDELIAKQKELQKKVEEEHNLMLKEKAARMAFADKLKGEEEKSSRLTEQLAAASKEQQQLLELKVNFAALQKENDRHKTEAAKAAALQTELNDANERIKQIESLRKQIAELQKQNQEYSDRNRQLQHAVTDQAEISMIRERLEKLQQENIRLQTEELPALRQKAQEYALLQNRLQSAEKRAEKLSKEAVKNDDLLQKIQQLENKLSDSRQQLQQQQILQQQKAERQETLLEMQKNEIARLQAELKDILNNTAAQNVSGEIAKLQQQLFSLNTEKQNLISVRQELEVQLKQEQERTAQLQQTAQKQLELTAALKKKEQEITLLQEEKKRSEEDYELLQQQIEVLQKENRELAAMRIVMPGKSSNTIPELDDLPELQISDTTSNATPEELILAGKKAEAEDNVEVAIWNYRAVLERNGTNMEAAGRLGLIYLKRDDFRRAEPLLAAARSVDPDDTTFTIANARALVGLGKSGNALALLEPLLKKSPENLDLLLLTAQACAAAGQLESSKELIQKALELYPKNPAPYLAYAKLLLAEDKEMKKEAANYYQTYLSLGGKTDIELQPKLAKLLDERKELQDFMTGAAAEAEKNQDWNSACWYYRQILTESSSGNNTVFAKLAFAYLMTAQYPAAAETLALNKPTPESSLIAALLQYMQGEYAGAAEKAKAAQKLNKDAPINLTKEWMSLKQELNKHLKNPQNPQQKQTAEQILKTYL